MKAESPANWGLFKAEAAEAKYNCKATLAYSLSPALVHDVEVSCDGPYDRTETCPFTQEEYDCFCLISSSTSISSSSSSSSSSSR